jgi:hypothetical protein
MRTPLNLPPINARIRPGTSGKEEIFDPLRRRFVKLTPEEWVRQHFIHLLLSHKNYPASLVAVEVPVTYNRLKKRSDIVAFGRSGKPVLLVECKAPTVPITQETFNQVAMYHAAFSGSFLILTNGLEHFACRIDQSSKSFGYLDHIPDYSEIADV